MASSAIFLTIIIPTIIASTSGFKIQEPQTTKSDKYSHSLGFPTPNPLATPRFISESATDYRNQPIAGYPKVPPPNAHESGGNEDDLLPPFENIRSGFDNPRSLYFRRSVEDVKVDPKTGYPLIAEPSWKYAGGNEDNLELPLDDSAQEAVDPKTGYPLVAKPHWRDAGGDEGIIALPLEHTEENFGQKAEAVDPKTGYPLKANPSWKDAGGNEEILDLPLEDLKERSKQEAVDPKTGYPLVAQPFWKNAGGNGDILELPLEDSKEKTEKVAVDPKTGYPLTAQPAWRDAGGDGDILQLPLNDSEEPNQVPVDPKTGYPLIAQANWKDAGGNGDILQLPLQPSDTYRDAVDPKTGYPLVAQPGWKDAGGDENILELPFDQPTGNSVSGTQDQVEEGRFHVFEIFKLTELQPPPSLEKNFPAGSSNAFSTPSPFSTKQGSSRVASSQIQKQNSFPTQRFNSGDELRPVESSYTYTGPENVVVTVTRFLNTDRQEKLGQSSNRNGRSRIGFSPNLQKPTNFPSSNGVPAQPLPSAFPQTTHQQNFSTFYQRHTRSVLNSKH